MCSQMTTGSPLSIRRPRAVTAVLWAGLAGCVAIAVHATTGLGGDGMRDAFSRWTYCAVMNAALVCVLWRAAAVSRHRAAWLAIAAGVALRNAGDLYWFFAFADMANPPSPSLCDAAWLAALLPTVIGVGLLLRSRMNGMPAAMWLDGLIASLALAAAASVFAFEQVLPGALDGGLDSLITYLYPVRDVALMGLLGAAAALAGVRPGRAWLLLWSGVTLALLADLAFVVRLRDGLYSEGELLDACWPLSSVLIATAAWLRPPDQRAATLRGAGLTGVFSLIPLSVLVYDTVNEVNLVSHVFVTLSVGAIMLRLWLAAHERRRLERSADAAFTDDLTGLGNRRAFHRDADAALESARSAARPVAVLLLDLDRFKELNDTLGHHAGDAMLRAVARRLSATLPHASLARLGGDEFVTILPGGEAEARAAAEAMRAALRPGVALDGLTAYAEASIGIALSPEDGVTRSDLLRHADIAMYRAKQRGTGVELHGGSGDGSALGRDRLALAAELRAALDTGEQLELHYQPKVELATGRVIGVEALARWRHPARGLLFPDVFIPLVERHGLMPRFTAAVLDEALSQQRTWRRAGLDLPVAANISAANLLDGGFPDAVRGLLERHRTPPGALELELTEHTIMLDPERALEVLHRLHGLGLSLALDDFGTGYSSLAHLKRLPVATLKIDKSFVLDMLSDRDDAIIVRSIIELGRNLRLHVVAEGVETAQHEAHLAAFGCHTAQGYHLTRPLPPEALEEWVQARSSDQAPAADDDAAAVALEAMVQAAADVCGASASASPGDSLECVAERLRDLVDYDDIAIYSLDAGAGMLRPVYADGKWAAETMAGPFPAEDGITGSAIRERRTRYVPRTDLDPTSEQVEGTEKEPESLVSVPLVRHDRPVGALNVYRVGESAAFSPAEVSTIERFAGFAVMALGPAGVESAATV